MTIAGFAMVVAASFAFASGPSAPTVAEADVSALTGGTVIVTCSVGAPSAPASEVAPDSSGVARCDEGSAIVRGEAEPVEGSDEQTRRIVIRNTSPAVIDPPILVTDLVPAGFEIVNVTPGWTCAPTEGRAVLCNASLPIPPQSDVELEMSLKAGSGLVADGSLEKATVPGAAPVSVPVEPATAEKSGSSTVRNLAVPALALTLGAVAVVALRRRRV